MPKLYQSSTMQSRMQTVSSRAVCPTCTIDGSYFHTGESNVRVWVHRSSLTHSTSLLPGCSASGTSMVPIARYPGGGKGSHIVTGLRPLCRQIRWNSFAGFTEGRSPLSLSFRYTCQHKQHSEIYALGKDQDPVVLVHLPTQAA